jgi:TonB family protein
MSKDKKTYRSIVEKDLIAYRKGILSQDRAHELERKALHSDFDGDALDGWEGHDANLLADDLKILRSKLATKRKNRFGFWMAIAAGILLLLTSGYLLRMAIFKINNDQPIAIITETKQADSIQNTFSPKEEKASEPIAEKPVAMKEAKKAKKPEPIHSLHVSENYKSQALVSVPDELEETIVEPIALEVAAADLEESKMIPTPQAHTPAIVKAEQKDVRSKLSATGAVSRAASAPANRDVNSQRTIIGMVRSASDNNVLPGATVTVKGTNRGTVSDIDGFFEITLEAGETQLRIDFIGFTTAEIVVTNQEVVEVEMQQDLLALDEVVVIGYGEVKRSELTGAVAGVEVDSFDNTYEKAKPSAGWLAFYDYLEKKKKMPEAALANNISGSVKLKLTVSTAGQITQIEIKKSLGYGCDEEAIRLVNEGGAWISAKRGERPVESTMNLKIDFP